MNVCKCENVIVNSSCVCNFYNWKIGTLNIRTGDEKSEGARMYSIAKEVSRLKMVVCCIQEVRYRNSGSKTIRLSSGDIYTFYWCGMKKRREYGVGILIKEDDKVKFTEPDVNDPRIIALNIEINGFKIRLVNAYAPTETASDSQKDTFYRALIKACATRTIHQKLMIAGDLNATTSISLQKCNYDGSGLVEDGICNDNGARLKRICRKLKLCISQSYFDYPLHERYTWYSADGVTKKVLDYMLVEKYIQQFVKNCSVVECDIQSDHKMVTMSLKTPSTKKARRIPKRVPIKQKIDVKSIKDTNVKARYSSVITDYLQNDTNPRSPSSISDNIINCLKFASETTLPKKEKRQTVREIWKNDEEFNNLLQLRSTQNKNTADYNETTKKIKKRVRYLRNMKMAAEAQEIEQFATRKQIDQLYRTFKTDYSTFKNKTTSNRCDPLLLKQHFEKHFCNVEADYDPVDFHPVPEFINVLQKINSHHIKSGPPDLNELTTVIKKLKDGKSANDIPSVFIKHAIDNEKFAKEMVLLYNTVFQSHVIPQQWRHSKLVALWKGPTKGAIDNPEAYRGLQIGSSLCKILVIIIMTRLQSWYESQLTDQQQGFRRDRGTTDGVFVAKRVQQVTRAMKKPVFLLFVDLSAAFDHVERSWLFATIKKRLDPNADKSLITLLEKLYSYTTTALSQSPDKIFETKTGVRQGGPESPGLFNLFIDFVMRIYLDSCKKEGIRFLKLHYSIPKYASNTERAAAGSFVMDWMGYADDLLLMFEDRASLMRGLELLDSTFRRFHLEINIKKTKTMVLNFQGNYPKTIVTLHGKPIDNVECFLYLGSSLTYNEASTGDTEINLRVDAAENKFYSLSKKFFNRRIQLKTRVEILNSLIRSRLVYSCPTWTISTPQQQKINACYLGLLRKMMGKCGYKRRDGEWAFVYTNEDVKRICSTIDITDFVRLQQRKFAAHIIRKENCSIVKRLYFNDNERRTRGLPSSTLRNNIIRNERCTEKQFCYMARERKF